MRRNNCFKVCLLLLCSIAGFTHILAQRLLQIPQPTQVGETSAAEHLQITLPHGGVVGRASVFTRGSEGAGFQLLEEECVSETRYLPGQTCSVTINLKPLSPGLQIGSVVLFDQSGRTLAARPLAAMATGAIANFVPAQITSVAGDSSFLYSGDGGIATQESLFLPFGVTLDGQGNLYIADTYNSRVRKVSAATQIISTVAGDGTLGASGDGGSALAARLNNPTSVELDSAGNLYIADTGNNAIRFVDASSGDITTIAGTLGTQGYTGDSGPATLATLQSPNGIALDSLGNLYIADTGNNVIRLVNVATGIISTFAGNGKAAYSGDGRAATSASLNAPWGVSLSTAGELYVADQKNNVIRKIDAAGLITTIAGSGSQGYSGDGLIATHALLNTPASIVIDAAGNIYVSDSGNNRIRKINPSTNIITTIAGDNTTTLQPDGYPANAAALYGPYTIALDQAGSLYIADVFHNRIRKLPSNTAILIYPSMRLNQVSTPLRQTIENDGNAPLDFSQLTAVSNAEVDPSTTCSPSTALAPLAQCVLAADFAPTAVGNPAKGSIVVQSNALNTDNTLLLQGIVQSTNSSNVLLSSTPNPSLVGNPVVFSIQVVTSGVTPTGTVMLLDGSATIATLTLTNGVAYTTLSNLSVGQHTLTASYGGDANTAAGVSLAILQIVNPLPLNATTTTSLTSSSNPILVGQTLTLNIVVSAVTSGQPVPTGTVNLLDGTTNIGTGVLSSGSAVISTATLTAGTHLLTAVYSGSASYVTSTSPVLTQLVVAANPATTLSLTSSADPATAGSTVTFTATVLPASTGQAAPTGTVTFMDGTVALGNGTLSGGIASYSTSTLSVGTHLITAVYNGSSTYTSSTSTVLTELVVSTGTGQSTQFTLTVTPSTLSMPTGSHKTLQIAIATAAAFTDTLSLGCGALPYAATCTFSQDLVPVTGGTTTAITVVFDTGNPLGAGQSASAQPRSARGATTLFAGIVPLGALLSLLFAFRLNDRRHRILLSAVLALSTLVVLSGCGTSFSSTSTPPGSYTFQIFASGTSSGTSYDVPIQLTVTK